MGGSMNALEEQDLPAESVFGNPTYWALATLALSVAMYAILLPDSCSSVPECIASHDSAAMRLNAYAACGLGMVLVGELATLISTIRSATKTQPLLPELKSRCMPSVLLVIAFLAQILEDAVLAASASPWFASARPDFQGTVYTVTFVQWLLASPLLLVMAGHCALGRPLRELGLPVVAANTCIVLAWAALLVVDSVFRWALLSVAFVTYSWVCLKIVLWVVDYAQDAPAGLPSRCLRPCLSLGLLAVLAAYSTVYVLDLLRIVAPQTERSLVLLLNVGTKLAFSVTFVVMRGDEYHLTLVGGLKTLSTSNVTLMSVLRGSFDVVLPCISDAQGGCKLPTADIADVQQLEHALLRPVAGLSFNDLLANSRERTRFAAYARSVQQRSRQGRTLEDDASSDLTGGALQQAPPAAQVLICRLGMGPVPAPAGVRPGTVACAVHLSVVPSSTRSCGRGGERMLAAVRLSEGATALGRSEEPTPVPGFEPFEPESVSEFPRSSSQRERVAQAEGGLPPRGSQLDEVLGVFKFCASVVYTAFAGEPRPRPGGGHFAYSQGAAAAWDGDPAFSEEPKAQHLQQLRQQQRREMQERLQLQLPAHRAMSQHASTDWASPRSAASAATAQTQRAAGGSWSPTSSAASEGTMPGSGGSGVAIITPRMAMPPGVMRGESANELIEPPSPSALTSVSFSTNDASFIGAVSTNWSRTSTCESAAHAPQQPPQQQQEQQQHLLQGQLQRVLEQREEQQQQEQQQQLLQAQLQGVLEQREEQQQQQQRQQHQQEEEQQREQQQQQEEQRGGRRAALAAELADGGAHQDADVNSEHEHPRVNFDVEVAPLQFGLVASSLAMAAVARAHRRLQLSAA